MYQCIGLYVIFGLPSLCLQFSPASTVRSFLLQTIHPSCLSLPFSPGTGFNLFLVLCRARSMKYVISAHALDSPSPALKVECQPSHRFDHYHYHHRRRHQHRRQHHHHHHRRRHRHRHHHHHRHHHRRRRRRGHRMSSSHIHLRWKRICRENQRKKRATTCCR